MSCFFFVKTTLLTQNHHPTLKKVIINKIYDKNNIKNISKMAYVVYYNLDYS